jgi:hypothetical protein
MAVLSSRETIVPVDIASSGVSWPAILAGSLAAAALSLILFVLGSGLGLTMASPWVPGGTSAAAFAVSTAVWLVFVQVVASGIGGYLAGRLRASWPGVQEDEVFFRDTAHGFFTWALATVIVAGLLGSAVGSVVRGSGAALTAVGAGAATGASLGVAARSGERASASSGLSMDYFVDMMFRPIGPGTAPAASPAPGTAGATGAAPTAEDSKIEASRILVMGIARGQMTAPDRTQLARLVSARTGASEADAQKRVDDVTAQIDAARQSVADAMEAARKAGLTVTLTAFLSLLVGAFVASAAAAWGGQHRDLP